MQPSDQRYVSKELTHFVGGEKSKKATDDERYQLLLGILRDERRLRSDPSRPTEQGWPRLDRIKTHGVFSKREMYHFPGVCFCDIPMADLAIHASKYGPFGIAFLKAFLVPRGASPVFYIANDSHVRPAPTIRLGIATSPSSPSTRATIFDEMLRAFHKLWFKLQTTAFEVGGPDTDDPKAIELADIALAVTELSTYIDKYVFSYCVPFDTTHDESDKEHFYMEREWRVLGDVEFSLVKVERVILPRDYANRFRADVPDYNGQVSFAT
jgi:Putative abortive phage resistance protein AbiGi, antitoxin